jgi:hypothetical protein
MPMSGSIIVSINFALPHLSHFEISTPFFATAACPSRFRWCRAGFTCARAMRAQCVRLHGRTLRAQRERTDCRSVASVTWGTATAVVDWMATNGYIPARRNGR